jgi:hypothetical protein
VKVRVEGVTSPSLVWSSRSESVTRSRIETRNSFDRRTQRASTGDALGVDGVQVCVRHRLVTEGSSAASNAEAMVENRVEAGESEIRWRV